MSYTLAIGSMEGSPKYHNQLKSLGQTLIKLPYQVILIKHNQNFYDQESSYFIVIEERWQKDIYRKNIRIRKQIIHSPGLKQQTNESDKNEEKKHSDNKKTYQIQCSVDGIEFSSQRVLAGNFINENAILVLKDPFQLFFLTEKSKKPIKIVLDQEYNLSEITAYFSFETNEQQKKKEPFLLTIYGFDNNDHRNKILSVNLMTFDVKQIQQSKQYSPKPRKNHFKTFHDDRLYVFGGQIKQSKQTEQLLWSFDMEKGYWFALEMKYAEELKMYDNYSSTAFESGKIVIFKNGFFFLLQIYQCKVSQIEMEHSSQLDLEALLKNKQIIGLFTFEKNIFFYTKSQILALTLKLQKSSQIKSFKKKENQKQLNQID